MASNTIVTPTKVAREVGRRLTNALKFTANVRRSYDDQFKVEGAKVGFTVNARLPQEFQVNKGQGLNPTAVEEKIVPITLTDQANVGLEFGMASLTMEIDDYRERYINPAVDALANVCDFDGLLRMYQATANTVGTPGTLPGATGTAKDANDVYLLANTKLTELAVPQPRVAMLTAAAHAAIASINATLFNPSNLISSRSKTGKVAGPALGIDEWFLDENIATHIVGPLGGVPLVNTPLPGNGATTVTTDGWSLAAGNRMKKGDVFQMAGVFAVNPISKQSTGRLRDFVATGDVDGDVAGAAVITFYPALIATGNYQNVTALPADGAAITIFGSPSAHANKVSRQGLVYHKDAYAVVFADLELPGGVWVAQRIANKAIGLSVRFVKDYNIMTDQSPARLDILYGWKAVRPEFGCRVCF